MTTSLNIWLNLSDKFPPLDPELILCRKPKIFETNLVRKQAIPDQFANS